jgi:hypothetical protein
MDPPNTTKKRLGSQFKQMLFCQGETGSSVSCYVIREILSAGADLKDCVTKTYARKWDQDNRYNINRETHTDCSHSRKEDLYGDVPVSDDSGVHHRLLGLSRWKSG